MIYRTTLALSAAGLQVAATALGLAASRDDEQEKDAAHAVTLTPEATIEFGGLYQQQQESFRNLTFVLIAALVRTLRMDTGPRPASVEVISLSDDSPRPDSRWCWC